MKALLRLSAYIDSINVWIGKVAAWFGLLAVVVCTVTGNGLKDPQTALAGLTAPTVIPVAAEAVTEAAATERGV